MSDEQRLPDEAPAAITAADVLARAQAAVRERHAAEARNAASRQRPWFWIAGVLVLSLILGVVLWPSGTLAGRLHTLVQGVCDQRHNVELGPTPLPLDARCTGIYAGFLVTLLYVVGLGRLRAGQLPPRPITLLAASAIALMAVDGFNSLLFETGGPHLYPPRNLLRLATGLGTGLAMVTLGLPLFVGALSADGGLKQRVFNSWAELAGAVVAAGVLFGMVALGPRWLFYPLAVFSVVGIVGALFMVNLAAVALFSGLRRRVRLALELARPAALSVALTAAELALLASARAGLIGNVTN